MSVRGGWGVYYVSCSKGTCGSLLHRAHREEKKQKGVGERGREEEAYRQKLDI